MSGGRAGVYSKSRLVWFSDPNIFIRVNYATLVKKLERVCKSLGVMDRRDEFLQEYFFRLLTGRLKYDPGRIMSNGAFHSLSGFIARTAFWMISGTLYCEQRDLERAINYDRRNRAGETTVCELDDCNVSIFWLWKRFQQIKVQWRKLTPADFMAILKMKYEGYTGAEIAKKFHVSDMAVTFVLQDLKHLYKRMEGSQLWKNPTSPIRVVPVVRKSPVKGLRSRHQQARYRQAA